METNLKRNVKFVAGILTAILIVTLLAPLGVMKNTVVKAAVSDDPRNAFFVTLRWGVIRNKAALDNGEVINIDLSECGIKKKDLSDYYHEFKYLYTDFYAYEATDFYVEAYTKDEINDDTLIKSCDLVAKVSLEDQNKLSSKIEEIASLIPEGLDDFDKVLFVHDYICTHCTYDPDVALKKADSKSHPKSYTAYGCLVEGMAVCEGYSKAYKMILDYIGIPCVIVISNKMHHCWNMVNIDNEWYHIDVTWDDPLTFDDVNLPGRALHNNFLKSDTAIVKSSYSNDHHDWVAPTTATSTKYDENLWVVYRDTQIQMVNGNYIYTKRGSIGVNYANYTIELRDHDGKTDTLLSYKLSNVFLDDMSSSCVIGDYLYFNTSTQIVRYSFTNKTLEVMFEDNNISMVAFYPDENGKSAEIAYEAPDDDEAYYKYKTISLSKIKNYTGESTGTAITIEPVNMLSANYCLASIGDLYGHPNIVFEDGSSLSLYPTSVEEPVVTPTKEPTETPVPTPVTTDTPTATAVPTVVATKAPTTVPTSAPTKTPEATVTTKPTNKPVATPSVAATPTPKPTEAGVAGFAERLYVTCLGRDSEADGKAYWIDELEKGMSGADAAKVFFFSPEFENLKLDDKEYVTRLYKTFMNREPEEDGLGYWFDEMKNGMDREFVFDGFVNSPEWADICKEYVIKPVTLDPVSAFADRLYLTCLGRESDAAGVKYWANNITVDKASASAVAHFFFFSDEFIGLDLNNQEYVTRLYKTFMDREPEEDGLKYWTSQLATTSSREDVFAGFAASPEWVGICADYGIMR